MCSPRSADAIGTAAGRIDGTTASFVRELVRRAVLAAALQGAPVTDAHHLIAAVDELMADSASLTRSLLGSSGRAPEDGVPDGQTVRYGPGDTGGSPESPRRRDDVGR